MGMKNTPTLKTQRLILRKFCAHDLEALFAIYADIEVNTFLPWQPLVSLQEAKRFYQEHYVQTYELPCAYQYAICLKNDDIAIGYVHVSMEEHHDLGYGLRKEFWHQGIVTEACAAVLEQLKTDGFAYVTATHDVYNPRSGHVMRRLGMRYQYSYEEQWLPKNMLVTFRLYQLNFEEDSSYVYQRYWDKSLVHFIEQDL